MPKAKKLSPIHPGRPPADPQPTLPLEFKKGLFSVLSAEVGREAKRRRTNEAEVQADFEAWRKGRRENGGRR